ncbi:NUMOD4 domain-containing protein [Bacillus wiedmannii]|uniref:NUMOD4 domain-containing protein n=1 Tax=Bacillus wiedmannii TaxID=1890302 RepID=UPI000CD9A53A|nr:NUMOD4 domain-containing protein [Bacillus wiedmannii]UOB95783.1 hypothetical protein BTI679_31270 [Bacillus wiedmannii]
MTVLTVHSNEEWRPVVGYEGVYEVSNFGGVRGVTRKLEDGRTYKGRRKSMRRHPRTGHWRTNLSWGGKKKIYYIHTLVAKAFCENPKRLPEVHFKDGNLDNFSARNLEWVDYLENRPFIFGNTFKSDYLSKEA